MSDNTATPETTPQEEFSSENFAREIAALTWDRKALNSIAVDLRGLVSYTDFLVICTATSDRQVQAIARHVMRELRELGYRPLSTEGIDSGRWALLDYGDAILHVFNQTARQDFDLEGMWVDAPRLELEDKPSSLYGHFAMDQFE